MGLSSRLPNRPRASVSLARMLRDGLVKAHSNLGLSRGRQGGTRDTKLSLDSSTSVSLLCLQRDREAVQAEAAG